jgi:two-component system, LuxR family, response regulator FixJ
MNTQKTVYVVEDDAGVRKAIGWMLECNGLDFEAFESGTAFLRDAKMTGPSCLILDMHLPGIGGIDILKATRLRPDLNCPVIVMTGNGTVVTAVQCMKHGADDFLEKPIDPVSLLVSIHDALARDAARRERELQETTLKKRFDKLTIRERDVLRLLCEGKSSKEMAAKLSISIKTVSIHRWHLMKKMQAGNATEVVNLAYRANAI